VGKVVGYVIPVCEVTPQVIGAAKRNAGRSAFPAKKRRRSCAFEGGERETQHDFVRKKVCRCVRRLAA